MIISIVCSVLRPSTVDCGLSSATPHSTLTLVFLFSLPLFFYLFLVLTVVVIIMFFGISLVGFIAMSGGW